MFLEFSVRDIEMNIMKVSLNPEAVFSVMAPLEGSTTTIEATPLPGGEERIYRAIENYQTIMDRLNAALSERAKLRNVK